LLDSLQESQWRSTEELEELQAELLAANRRNGRGGATFGRTVSSSGTGGQATAARWSVEAMRWQDAVEERSRAWAGAGDGRSRVWICCTPADRVRRVGAFVSNTRLLAAGDVARDESRLRALADLMEDTPPEVVQGVSNVLAALGRELERRGVALRETVCISAGNHLTPWYRRAMEAAFASPVRERYAVSEVGLIAATCERGTLHVNAETALVEALDEAGSPVPRGVAGELAVTMLRNRSGARRSVGDVGRLVESSCACGRGLPVLELWGRLSEQIRVPGGRPVPPRTLFAAIDDPAIVEAQLRLGAPAAMGVSVRLDPRLPEPDLDRLAQRATAALDGAIEVKVRAVDRLVPGRSGKLPLVLG
jgi:phenylacetate-CoA ligase